MVHRQPYEFVVHFNGQPAPVEKPKHNRSRNGCVSCRQRRRKCDEQKPSCSLCLHKGITCTWTRPKSKKQLREEAFKVIQYEAPSSLETRPPDARQSETQEEVIYQSVETPDFTSGANVDDDVTFQSQKVVPLDDSTITTEEPHLSQSLSLFSNFLQPSAHDRFVSAAINGFIVAVGPQTTHPLLTTMATFTPIIQTNDILMNVAEACGVSFLSWETPELATSGALQHQKVCDSLVKYIDTNGIRNEDVLWMVAALQLTCLGEKTAPGGDRKMVVKMLKMAWEVVKTRMRGLCHQAKRRSFCSPVGDIGAMSDNLCLEVLSDESLTMEIENAMIGSTEMEDIGPSDALERMFFESFIFNYSIAILITPKDENLPNPFDVFKDSRRYLKTPIFSCDVAWMNNPVVGASLDAFEIVAKASYLIRRIDEPWVVGCAKKLMDITDYFAPHMVPPDLRRRDPVKFNALRDSVIVSEIVMKAAKIVLRKCLDPSMRETDEIVQFDVSCAMQKLKQITPMSSVYTILGWPLLVIGLACVEQEHKMAIINACQTCGEISHGRFVYSIIDALSMAWGKEHAGGEYVAGLDALLDIDLLSTNVVL